MKFIILLQSIAFSAVLFVVGCAHRPTSTAVDLNPLSGGLDRIDSHLTAISKAKPSEVKPIVTAAKGTVATMRLQLSGAEEQVKKLASERDWWKTDSSVTREDLKKEKLATSRYQGKLRLIGIVLASVSALLVFSLSTHLTAYMTALAPAAMPYVLALRLGLAAMAFVSVFSWVRYW